MFGIDGIGFARLETQQILEQVAVLLPRRLQIACRADFYHVQEGWIEQARYGSAKLWDDFLHGMFFLCQILKCIVSSKRMTTRGHPYIVIRACDASRILAIAGKFPHWNNRRGAKRKSLRRLH
jgi:hypothetical protein